jgi:hypothetical protein
MPLDVCQMNPLIQPQSLAYRGPHCDHLVANVQHSADQTQHQTEQCCWCGRKKTTIVRTPPVHGDKLGAR